MDFCQYVAWHKQQNWLLYNFWYYLSTWHGGLCDIRAENALQSAYSHLFWSRGWTKCLVSFALFSCAGFTFTFWQGLHVSPWYHQYSFQSCNQILTPYPDRVIYWRLRYKNRAFLTWFVFAQILEHCLPLAGGSMARWVLLSCLVQSSRDSFLFWSSFVWWLSALFVSFSEWFFLHIRNLLNVHFWENNQMIVHPFIHSFEAVKTYPNIPSEGVTI